MKDLYVSEWEEFEELDPAKQIVLLLSGGYTSDVKKAYNDVAKFNGNAHLPPIEDLMGEACSTLKRDFGYGDNLENPDQVVSLGETYVMLGRKNDAEGVGFNLLKKGNFPYGKEILEYILEMRKRENFKTYARKLRERRELKKNLKLYREWLRKAEDDLYRPAGISYKQKGSSFKQRYNINPSEIEGMISDIKEQLKITPSMEKIKSKYRKVMFKMEENYRARLQENAEKFGYGYDLFLEELGIKKGRDKKLKSRERKYLKGKAMDFLREGETEKAFEIFKVLDQNSLLRKKRAKRFMKYMEGTNWNEGRLSVYKKYMGRKNRFKTARDTALLMPSYGALGGLIAQTIERGDVKESIILASIGGIFGFAHGLARGEKRKEGTERLQNYFFKP